MRLVRICDAIASGLHTVPLVHESSIFLPAQLYITILTPLCGQDTELLESQVGQGPSSQSSEITLNPEPVILEKCPQGVFEAPNDPHQSRVTY